MNTFLHQWMDSNQNLPTPLVKGTLIEDYKIKVLRVFQMTKKFCHEGDKTSERKDFMDKLIVKRVKQQWFQRIQV